MKKNRRIPTTEELEDARRLKAAYLAFKSKNKHITQDVVAELCGFQTQSAVSQYMTGHIPLNLEALLKLSTVLNVSPEEISPIIAAKLKTISYESKQADYNFGIKEALNKIKTFPRVVGTARCGNDGYYMDLEGGDGYIEFEAEAGSIAIRIKGHSMHPAIREGWYVVIEPNKQPDLGEYVLIKFKDGRKMVKELIQIRSDSYLLLSVNDNERITAQFEELEGIQAITAIVPPSKHKEW